MQRRYGKQRESLAALLETDEQIICRKAIECPGLTQHALGALLGVSKKTIQRTLVRHHLTDLANRLRGSGAYLKRTNTSLGTSASLYPTRLRRLYHVDTSTVIAVVQDHKPTVHHIAVVVDGLSARVWASWLKPGMNDNAEYLDSLGLFVTTHGHENGWADFYITDSRPEMDDVAGAIRAQGKTRVRNELGTVWSNMKAEAAVARLRNWMHRQPASSLAAPVARDAILAEAVMQYNTFRARASMTPMDVETWRPVGVELSQEDVKWLATERGHVNPVLHPIAPPYRHTSGPFGHEGSGIWGFKVSSLNRATDLDRLYLWAKERVDGVYWVAR